MKAILKIISLINLLICFYLLVLPVTGYLNPGSLGHSDQQFEAFCESTNGWVSLLPSQDSHRQSAQGTPVQFIEKGQRLIALCLFSGRVNGYHRHNDLDFNLPLICYKFPLAEHSEEG